MKSMKQSFKEYGIGAILVGLVVLYGLYIFLTYLQSKGGIGYEANAQMQNKYKQSGGYSGELEPADPNGNQTFASVSGMQSTNQPVQSVTKYDNIQDPHELLPKDTNSQWGDLNPNGSGNLQGIGLLAAGYHAGIDTIGQTNRNPTQDIRGEPPNPQIDTGPWNRSTIEPAARYRRTGLLD